MKLTVVGCGDAFGSGGRLQTCYHVEAAATRFLIDCGATTLIGFSKLGLDPNTVETIFISHLHGDHFAGLVWWLLMPSMSPSAPPPSPSSARRACGRASRPRRRRCFRARRRCQRRYDLRFLELTREKPLDVGSVRVTPFEVKHPSRRAALCAALRARGQGAELHRRHGMDRGTRSRRARCRSLHHGVLPVRGRAALPHELEEDLPASSTASAPSASCSRTWPSRCWRGAAR